MGATVFFPGEVNLEDGSRIETGAPKTYRAKEIKISTTHMIFVDLLGVKHEIKL